jgi:hypothetical protein
VPLTQVVAGNRILASDLNAFYNLLKGVAASGEAITLIYNQTALIFQPSSDPAAGTRVLDIKNNAGTHLMSIDFNGVLELLSTATAPSGAVAGAVYFDTVFGALRFYDGVNWQTGAPFLGDTTGRWLWDWDGKATIESTLVGTGVYTIAAVLNTYAAFGTGAISGGSSAGRIQIGGGGTALNGVGKMRAAKFIYQYGQIDANMNSKVYITDESVTGNPSDTANHLGIRQAGASLFFSTANNTTEQATDISAAFAAGTDVFIDITFDGTTARCYVNNVIKATHATNVPISAGSTPPIFRVYVVNSAAAAKNIYFTKVHLVFIV